MADGVDRDATVLHMVGRNGATVLFFDHRNWKEPSELFRHSNCKWASFLLGLKGYLENGQSSPHPYDLDL